MNVSLYQAASAMHAMDRWQETIAENLAASSVPGYKKQEFVFSGVAGGFYQPTPGSAATRSAVVMPSGGVSTSFAAGMMRPTNNPTDVAIDGPGFFEVQLANGAIAYTRDGEFHFNAQGQLVTKEGFAVVGEGGPIQLDLNNPKPVTISATGEVSQGGEVRGRLRLLEFADAKQLTRLSGGYFAGGQAAASGQPLASTVRQGFLEASNASAVTEMAAMMTAMRSFEANQRVAQLQDERIGRTIRDLEQLQ